MPTPLFVCHANCARSVLAAYLYRHMTAGAPCLSAGFEPGPCIAAHAEQMLRQWGILADDHCPQQLTRELCDEAGAIFLMGPTYLHRLLRDFGKDLASKAYLFADPFSKPWSFARGEYRVADPTFDRRPTHERNREWSWMRERVLQVRLAMLGEGRPLIPATEYLELCLGTDPDGH